MNIRILNPNPKSQSKWGLQKHWLVGGILMFVPSLGPYNGLSSPRLSIRGLAGAPLVTSVRAASRALWQRPSESPPPALRTSNELFTHSFKVPKYVKQRPAELVLQALGSYLTYFWGSSHSKPREPQSTTLNLDPKPTLCCPLKGL